MTPLAIRTSRVFGEGLMRFSILNELGRRMIQITGDLLTRCHMTQQILVALQKGNAVSVLGTIGQSTPL